MKMSPRNRAYCYVGMAVLFWSTVASAFKLALASIDFMLLLFYAALASTAAMFVVIILQGKLWALRAQTRKNIAGSALLGLLNPFGYYLILFKAYSLLPAQEAQPLNWTWPIVLIVFAALFLGQKLRLRTIASILISFLGVMVIALKGDLTALRFSNLFGYLIAVGTSFIWAAYWIFNLRDLRDPVIKLFTNFVFGAIYITILILVLDRITLPRFDVLAIAVYIGLFEMGLTFIIWLRALTLAESSAKIANLIYITPFLSLVFIRFIVGESIHTSSVIGLALIISGILLQNLKRQ